MATPQEYFVWLADKEWEVKASLEARSGSLVASQTAAIAAALAIGAVAKTDTPLGEGAPLFFVGIAGGSYAASLILALLTGVPMGRPSHDIELMEKDLLPLSSEASDPDRHSRDLNDVARVRLRHVRKMQKTNQLRARMLLAAFVFFGISLLSYGLALTIAL